MREEEKTSGYAKIFIRKKRREKKEGETIPQQEHKETESKTHVEQEKTVREKKHESRFGVKRRYEHYDTAKKRKFHKRRRSFDSYEERKRTPSFGEEPAKITEYDEIEKKEWDKSGEERAKEKELREKKQISEEVQISQVETGEGEKEVREEEERDRIIKEEEPGKKPESEGKDLFSAELTGEERRGYDAHTAETGVSESLQEQEVIDQSEQKIEKAERWRKRKERKDVREEVEKKRGFEDEEGERKKREHEGIEERERDWQKARDAGRERERISRDYDRRREKESEIEIYSGEGVISSVRPKRFFRDKRRGRREKDREFRPQPPKEPPRPRKIKVPEAIRIADLSKLTGIKASEIIAKLLELGKEATINQLISAEEAELICSEFNIQVEKEEFDETKYFDLSPDPEDKLKPRPPVVVVMGHVDHGKTTLLDAIRETNIAEKEVGGITQSIGAYTVEVGGKIITFIDTPGHEAFTEMRARGARVADIAVLVVAADEGVKPQTEEAINHAKAAELPIVVAINKIDKPGANPEKVKKELSEFGLIPDDWGGDTLFSEISAKKRVGIDDLLEKILIQAELLDLKANPDRPAEGVIIESGIDRGLGAVATVIVQRGTLKKGDVVVSGFAWGRVRNIFSDKGKIIKEVYPGFPAKIVIGGEDVPVAGDKLYVVQNEDIAERIVEERKRREMKRSSISLETIFEKISQSEEKVILPVVLKANSQGALDALEKEIMEIKAPELEIKIIHKGIGIVSQSDVNLAAASQGIVVGYNVKIEKQAQNLAKMHGVQIRLYKIIYEIIDDIKKAIRGMLKPKETEVVVGTAKVLKLFKVSAGKVLGCFVEKGKIQLGLPARVRRNGEIVGEGKVISLKRFKDSVNEVKEGEECGVMIEGVKDAKENDIVECYQIVKEEVKI